MGLGDCGGHMALFPGRVFLVTTLLSLYIRRRQTLVDLGKEQKQFWLPSERSDTVTPLPPRLWKTIPFHYWTENEGRVSWTRHLSDVDSGCWACWPAFTPYQQVHKDGVAIHSAFFSFIPTAGSVPVCAPISPPTPFLCLWVILALEPCGDKAIADSNFQVPSPDRSWLAQTKNESNESLLLHFFILPKLW